MDYEKALEKARSAYGTGAYDDATLEFLFPQLKESEDEQVRKAMLQHFKNKTKEKWCNIPVKDIISWLEKQKDHFRIVTKMVEQKPAEWSEEDEKMLEIVIANYEYMFDKLRKGDDSDGIADHILVMDWLKSLRPQPKAELTLFDKNIISAAVAFVELNPYNYWCGIDKRTVIKALRSLCPSWSPSEEQIEALERCVEYLEESDNEDADILAGLCEHLKKLM